MSQVSKVEILAPANLNQACTMPTNNCVYAVMIDYNFLFDFLLIIDSTLEFAENFDLESIVTPVNVKVLTDYLNKANYNPEEI